MVFSWVCRSCFILSSVVHMPNSAAFHLGLLLFWVCCSLPGAVVPYQGLFMVYCSCFLLSSVVHLLNSVGFFQGLFFHRDCCSSPGAEVLYQGLLMGFSWVCCFCFCCSSTVTNSVALYLGLLFF
jgi:hypothetical protein